MVLNMVFENDGIAAQRPKGDTVSFKKEIYLIYQFLWSNMVHYL